MTRDGQGGKRENFFRLFKINRVLLCGIAKQMLGVLKCDKEKFLCCVQPRREDNPGAAFRFFQTVFMRSGVTFFTFVYDYVFICQIAAVSAALLIVFYPFEKAARSWLLALAHFLILFAAGTLLNWGVFALSSVWTFLGGINFHIAWLLVVVLYLCFCRMPVYPRIITGAVLFAAVLCMTELARQVMNTLPPVTDWSFINLLFYILIDLYAYLLRRFSLAGFQDIPTACAAVMLGQSFLTAALILAETVLNVRAGTFSDLYYMLTLIVLSILIVSDYMIIYVHCRERNAATELAIRNRLLESDRQVLAVSGQAVGELNQLRDETERRLDVALGLLRAKQYPEAEEYLVSLRKSVRTDSSFSFVDCGNPLVNSVVNMEILRADSLGVRLMTKIHVPERLPLDPSDLSRILIGLLDYAFSRILASEDRDYLVDFRLGCRYDFLYASVQYKASGMRNAEGGGRDPETEFSSRTVKKTAEKYNGIVRHDTEDGECVDTVLLECPVMNPKKEEKEENDRDYSFVRGV